ncbi:MAG: methyltransferase, partial [Anaerolineales bacterium]|nr:methyltransferase [Anaerolineales bacterium]
MARLASVEKAGFYPLPTSITDRILTHLAAPHGGRILDPCAGKGVALAHFAEALALEPYGAELHHERAEAATENVVALQGRDALPLQDPHVRRLVCGDYKLLNVTLGGVNLLYLNPPYNHDHEAGRLEYQFLRDSRPWLQPDGVLLFVIPQPVLGFRKLARYLASWFADLQIWRFPQPEYSAFRQVVLFGTRRERAHAPETGAVTRLVELAAQGEGLPALPWATAPSFTLPAPRVPAERYHFASRYVDHEDAIQEAAAAGVRTTARWRERLTVRDDLRLPVR